MKHSKVKCLIQIRHSGMKCGIKEMCTRIRSSETNEVAC